MVVPAETSAENVLELKPDGVFLSEWAGRSGALWTSLRGAGLSASFWGACPCSVSAWGINSPGWRLADARTSSSSGTTAAITRVRNNATGKVEITAHNHNFAVDPDSINANEVELTHVDLNDQTLEGLRHKTLPLFSVQYHPEAAPGPHDSHYLFHDFRQMMEEWKG